MSWVQTILTPMITGVFVVGFLLLFTVVGIFLGLFLMFVGPFVAWVWALITGIQMIIKES